MKKTLLKVSVITVLFLLTGKITLAQWQKVNDIDSFSISRPTVFVLNDTAYVGNGDISFFAYGNAFHGYTQNGNTWVNEPAYPGGGGDDGFCFVINDTAYVGDGANPGFEDTFFAYTPSTGWKNLASPPGGGRQLSVGFSIGSKGYFGTGNNGIIHNDFYEYDPSNNTWTQKANVPVARVGAIGFAINGKGYIGLGANGTGATFRDMYKYTPATDTWDAMASMPSDTGMEEPAYFVICGKLIVTLGDSVQSGNSTTKQTWLFDPSKGPKGTWTRLQDFPGPQPDYAPGGWAMGDTGFVYGGYDAVNNNYYRQDMYRYVSTLLGLGITTNIVDTTICNGSAVTLSASGGNNYLWSNTDTTSSITVAPATDTTYTVTIASGACYTTDTIMVTVSNAPAISITPSPAIVCSGDSITLTAMGGLSYLWNNGDTVSTITVTPITDTIFSVTAQGVCGDSAISDTVNVNPLPTITQHGDSLISSSKYHNQWYSNDSTFADTSQYFILTNCDARFYGVSANGCSSAADSVELIASPERGIICGGGIDRIPLNIQVSIFPNPNSGDFTTTSSPENLDEVCVTDLLGRVIYDIYPPNAASSRINIHLQNEGMYFVTVRKGAEVYTSKIIVSK